MNCFTGENTHIKLFDTEDDTHPKDKERTSICNIL